MSNSSLPRIAERPLPSLWDPDELLSLPEAAELFWPSGFPITVTGLRTAVRDGKLEVCELNGKIFTSRSAIGRMSRCEFRRRGAEVAGRPREVKPRRGRPPAPARA
ncbi:hypothetical protein [Bradyrhizobium sp. CCBAU 53380]|uniref:hypothetical protein n=1 Tax=Bradyrhizobium sp. CCBAU 53380 TaxID=1325117 RepID=UPI0023047EBE|nr:hypothetical protein [Bradyrhizobium sp. CCBAU 53380]MDA9422918.1 hypothetical protein [Bradyrhizobium sp. CCBAU 53380]